MGASGDGREMVERGAVGTLGTGRVEVLDGSGVDAQWAGTRGGEETDIDMISLRCQNNRKAAEVNPESGTLEIKCRTCSNVWGRTITHPWSIDRLQKAIAAGQHDGVMYPDALANIAPD